MHTGISSLKEVPTLVEKYLNQGYTKFEVKQNLLGQLVLIAK